MSEHFRAYKHEGKPVITSDDRKRFAAHLEQFGDGEELVITVNAFENTRSDKQSAAFHACLTRWAWTKVNDYATSSDVRELVEQIKDDLLALQFGYIVRQNQFTGEVVKTLVKPHTSRLTTKEFTDLFDLAALEAAKDHHVMVMPDEYLEAKAAAQKKLERDAAKRAKQQRRVA